MKMNIAKSLLALALLAAASGASAQSADVAITGKIFPAACTTELGNGGTIELGDILAEKLNASSETFWGATVVPMTVTCQSAVRFAFIGIDNADGTASEASRYGLGLSPSGEKIGGYVISYRDPLGDRAPVHYTRSPDLGLEWETSGNDNLTWLGKNSFTGFSAASGVVSGPDPFKSLQVNLEVKTYLQGRDELTIEGDVPVNGSMTVDFLYL